MQTFLQYPNFFKVAETLDFKRLGKQRVEAFQILNAIEMRKLGIDKIYIKSENRYKSIGWYNHPATITWEKYSPALKMYFNIMVREWKKRGYCNTMKLYDINEPIVIPPFIGNKKLHASHRSNLLRKDFKYYSQFGWTESPDLPYYWP